MKRYFILLILIGLVQFLSAQKSENYLKIINNSINKKFKDSPEYFQENRTALRLANDLAVNLSKIDKTNENQLFNNAFTAFESSDITKALEILSEENLAKEPTVSNFLLKARLCILNFSFYDAELCYENALKMSKSDFKILIELGQFYYQQDMFTRAKVTFEEALLVSKEPVNEAIAYKNLGILYHSWQLYNVSINNLNKSKDLFAKINKKQNQAEIAEIYFYNSKNQLALKKIKEAEEQLSNSEKNYQNLVKKDSKYYLNLINIHILRADLFHIKSDNRNAKSQLFTALKICVDKLATKPIDMFSKQAECYYKLAIINKLQNNYSEALEEGKKTLEIYEKLTEMNKPEFQWQLADIQNNLGVIYSDMHYYDESLKMYEGAFKNYSELDHHQRYLSQIGMANVHNNLGNLYKYKAMYSEAEIHYNQSLTIFRALSDKDPYTFLPDIALNYNNLGLLYDRIDENEIALENYNKALTIRQKLAESEPRIYKPLVAATLTNLGNLYRKTDQLELALVNLQGAVMVYDNFTVNDPDFEPQLATAYNNLGVLFKSQQKYNEAKQAYFKALEIRERLCTKSEVFLPGLADVQINMGLLYHELGELNRAQEFLTLALVNRKKIALDNSPESHNQLANNYDYLGNVYQDASNFDAANDAYKQALEIREILVTTKPELYTVDMAFTLQNQSNLYRKFRKFDDGLKVTERLAAIYEMLEEQYPNEYLAKIADTQNNLALLYSSLERRDEALSTSEKVLLLYRTLAARKPERYQPDVAMTYNHLGNIYFDMKRTNDALQAYQYALDIRKKLAMDNQISYAKVADTQNNLGLLYADIQKDQLAVTAFKDAINIYETVAIENPEEFDVKMSMTIINLCSLYQKLLLETSKKTYKDEALEIINKALKVLQRYPRNKRASDYMEYLIQMKGSFVTFSPEK